MEWELLVDMLADPIVIKLLCTSYRYGNTNDFDPTLLILVLLLQYKGFEQRGLGRPVILASVALSRQDGSREV